jgi:hypothetical protein
MGQIEQLQKLTPLLRRSIYWDKSPEPLAPLNPHGVCGPISFYIGMILNQTEQLPLKASIGPMSNMTPLRLMYGIHDNPRLGGINHTWLEYDNGSVTWIISPDSELTRVGFQYPDIQISVHSFPKDQLVNGRNTLNLRLLTREEVDNGCSEVPREMIMRVKQLIIEPINNGEIPRSYFRPLKLINAFLREEETWDILKFF